MSLRINTNFGALDALRNLNTVGDQLNAAQTRLSTGLRINSPGDDPAGLIIAQGLNSQILGASQAGLNTQDGINLIKTADSSLSEVSDLLQSLRTLALSSANAAVNDTSTYQANQSQAQSILSSIDRIASSASYGSLNLLDGSAGIRTAVTDTTDVLALGLGSSFASARLQTGPVTLAQAVVGKAALVDLGKGFSSANVTLATNSTVILNGFSIGISKGDSIQKIVNKINSDSAVTGVNAKVVALATSVQIELSQVKFGSQYSVTFQDPSKLLSTATSSSSTGQDAVYNVAATTDQGIKTTLFTGGAYATDTGLKLSDGKGNTILLTPSAMANVTTNATVVGAVSFGSLQFQVGSASGDVITANLPNIATSQLATSIFPGKSLANIDITSGQGATQALAYIDAAVDQVNQKRADLGSLQTSALTSTSQWLSIAKENLSSSLSQIQDSDIAADVTERTRLQILQQSGLAVLAQANQQPQTVLGLLKQ